MFSASQKARQPIHLFPANRKTADISLLLVSKVIGRTCGIAYLDVSRNPRYAYGVVMGPCAKGVTAGHEVGHLFGTMHDRATVAASDARNYRPRDPNAFGKRIDTGRAIGYASIMA